MQWHGNGLCSCAMYKGPLEFRNPNRIFKIKVDWRRDVVGELNKLGKDYSLQTRVRLEPISHIVIIV